MVNLKYRNMPHCTIQQCRTNTYIISLTALFTPLSHMQNPQLDGLRGLPSWAWQKCNRLLRLGRP